MPAIWVAATGWTLVLGCARIAQSGSLQTQGRRRKPENSQNPHACASLLREMMFIHRVIYIMSSHWGPQTITIQMERRYKDSHGTHVCSLCQISVLFLTALLVYRFLHGRNLCIFHLWLRFQTSGFCLKTVSAGAQSFSWPIEYLVQSSVQSAAYPKGGHLWAVELFALFSPSSSLCVAFCLFKIKVH